MLRAISQIITFLIATKFRQNNEKNAFPPCPRHYKTLYHPLYCPRPATNNVLCYLSQPSTKLEKQYELKI